MNIQRFDPKALMLAEQVNSLYHQKVTLTKSGHFDCLPPLTEFQSMISDRLLATFNCMKKFASCKSSKMVLSLFSLEI